MRAVFGEAMSKPILSAEACEPTRNGHASIVTANPKIGQRLTPDCGVFTLVLPRLDFRQMAASFTPTRARSANIAYSLARACPYRSGRSILEATATPKKPALQPNVGKSALCMMCNLDHSALAIRGAESAPPSALRESRDRSDLAAPPLPHREPGGSSGRGAEARGAGLSDNLAHNDSGDSDYPDAKGCTGAGLSRREAGERFRPRADRLLLTVGRTR